MSENIRLNILTTMTTVLLVEDAVAMRMPIASYLRECGYRVIEAASSDEALEVLEEDSIAVDVIFCDVRLKGALSGFAFINWVRDNRPAVKVVTVGTPRGAAEAAGDLCETGPQLAMPYEPKNLEEHIRRLIAVNGKTP